MAGKAENKMQSELGCGFMGRIFHLTRYKLRKSSVHSLPMKASNSVQSDHSKTESEKPPNNESSAASAKSHNQARRIPSDHRRPPTVGKNQNPRPSDAARSSTSSSGNSSQTKIQQNRELIDDGKIQRQPPENSLELARISTHYQRENGNKSPLKLTGNLLVNNRPRTRTGCLEIVPENRDVMNSLINSRGNASRGVTGNIMRKNMDELAQFRSPKNRADPEVLKTMGNEAYKQGRFEEALALYERAIAVDSNKATFHCNKSAALIGLGRLLEAIVECQEAIRLEPSYNRPHHRLATIYLRLGEVEKALSYNVATPYSDPALAFQAQSLRNHLQKCIEARKINEWDTVLKETQSAIALGADSSPQVYALQTEALLKLFRHEEAYAAYEKMPKFAINWCTKLFGLARSAYLFVIAAQVYLAAGRFEDAVTAAEQASKLDPSDKEVSVVVKRARGMTSARMSGNLLFKASKYTEACAAYSEGLELDPYNSVLLCNRAACRSKLGQFEKAIDDCNAALAVQPSYSKARLRRADCNAKLERWESAIQDYEMLLREKSGDEEVGRALFEAQLQLKMLHGEDIKSFNLGSNLVSISSNDQFRRHLTSPGTSVVLFCNNATRKQVLLMLEQTCKRFPSVNFLKVEIEDHPYLAKLQGVSSVPTFKIYKDRSMVKEIPGNNHELLERSIKMYSS
ncbi:TPR repeat-containing thioredoxin TTL1 [Prosopis cineraria]|uniref:TPR repeat-containing thioredoxin TTL1 n=1 Tax=Prosopis cineraria TaxID=364024 RepID=UPI00240FE1EC|nr:TPR repeat-containing thioredoxin TTL1 [Prosopis cineraria]